MALPTQPKERISADEVRYVARLAQVTLRPAELEPMQRDLSRILDYVAKLDELDTRDVPPTAHAAELPTKLRDDEPRPGLPFARVMENAPERLGDGFGVPKIIE